MIGILVAMETYGRKYGSDENDEGIIHNGQNFIISAIFFILTHMGTRVTKVVADHRSEFCS